MFFHENMCRVQSCAGAVIYLASFMRLFFPTLNSETKAESSRTSWFQQGHLHSSLLHQPPLTVSSLFNHPFNAIHYFLLHSLLALHSTNPHFSQFHLSIFHISLNFQNFSDFQVTTDVASPNTSSVSLSTHLVNHAATTVVITTSTKLHGSAFILTISSSISQTVNY